MFEKFENIISVTEHLYLSFCYNVMWRVIECDLVIATNDHAIENLIVLQVSLQGR